MDNPKCVINPITKRAVKADSKLGKQILAKQNKTANTQYKKADDVRPNRKDYDKKKELEKKPNTMYKKAIGPKVENIPPILKKNYYGTNKTLDVQYKDISTKNKDGSVIMKKVVDNEKSKMVDVMFWRYELPTKEEINVMRPKYLIMNMMEFLGRIDAYIKLNVKLEKDDEANFNALYPTIEMLLDQIDKLSVNAEEFLTKPQYETYKKYNNKYMKLRKKIKGQKENLYEEREAVYNKPNIYPRKTSKPDYTKEGYFEYKNDFYNFLSSLVNLKPEVKDLYQKHKLDIATFVEKLHKMDKRIPPTTLLIERLDYHWVYEFFKIFGNKRRR